MDAVREHGEPLIEDADRVGIVTALRVTRPPGWPPTKDHPTLFATGLVDLRAKVVIDVIEGNAARDLGSWLDRQPAAWLGQIPVAIDTSSPPHRAARCLSAHAAGSPWGVCSAT